MLGFVAVTLVVSAGLLAGSIYGSVKRWALCKVCSAVCLLKNRIFYVEIGGFAPTFTICCANVFVENVEYFTLTSVV
jgi:hypothetical protein